ncbi:sensor histidine kinase [Sphingomonas bacterium]|uniref:sensor histidine kinase n=1 Tax=Sphingomonas bacterium TaxID=1895847 RepID=UPI001575A466|nr:response regulator [Sphingomonas bacterium]
MAEPRVLYIDDDAGLRRLAGRALERRGFAVTPADGGAAGLALATAERFDLVAVDHYMPEMNGLETLERLRALPEPPPVVYVTGSDEGRIAVAALKAGAADYVVKTVGDDFYDLLGASFASVLERTTLERAKTAVEADLRASNARLEALLGEVNHRVANSLQMVSAIIRLQAGALADAGARDALADTQRRIDAIAQVHRRLYTSSDVESVEMQGYLAALIDELAGTWSSDAAPRRLSLAADPVRLPPDRAVSLGVIVSELVSNACKYAYGAAAGEVRVALKAGDAYFTMTVEDDGRGLIDGAAPQGTGLGTKLIRAMTQSLGGTLAYDTDHQGVRAVLTAAMG